MNANQLTAIGIYIDTEEGDVRPGYGPDTPRRHKDACLIYAANDWIAYDQRYASNEDCRCYGGANKDHYAPYEVCGDALVEEKSKTCTTQRGNPKKRTFRVTYFQRAA